MSKWLALAEEAPKESKSLPDTMTKPDKTPSKQPERAFCRVLSNCQVESENKVTLPVKPATCAVCGKSDWLVSLTDTDGRHFHVECWLAGKKAASIRGPRLVSAQPSATPLLLRSAIRSNLDI